MRAVRLAAWLGRSAKLSHDVVVGEQAVSSGSNLHSSPFTSCLVAVAFRRLALLTLVGRADQS